MDYDKIMVELNKRLVKSKKAAHKIFFTEIIIILKEYVDPWICPHCQWVIKVPPDPKNPQRCAVCKKNDCMTYGYKEQARMNEQLKMLLSCASYYAETKDGAVAQGVLQRLGEAERPEILLSKPKT